MRHISREDFSRIEKLLFDSEDVDSPEEAKAALAGFSVNVEVGEELSVSPQHQIALLTLCVLGLRCLPGGLRIGGLNAEAPLLAPMLPASTIGEAVALMLGDPSGFGEHNPSAPYLHLGSTSNQRGSEIELRCTFGNWSGAVSPLDQAVRLCEDSCCPLAPMLSAGLSVSEVFQSHRARLGHKFSNIEAGYRTQGFSLWKPAEKQDWRAVQGPNMAELVLPDSFWLLGLGHLGQAYSWGLLALPFHHRESVHLVLNDFDVATASNLETSILTGPGEVGRKKTRFLAKYLESLGFGTSIVERPFDSTLQRMPFDPEVLLCGVDNLETRRHLDQHGFPLVVDAGLGGRHGDYLEMSFRRYPGSVSSKNAYPAVAADDGAAELLQSEGYRRLAERMDRCGLERVAGAAVGVPFVGTIASSLVLSWAARRLEYADNTDHLQMSLDAPEHRRASPSG